MIRQLEKEFTSGKKVQRIRSVIRQLEKECTSGKEIKLTSVGEALG